MHETMPNLPWVFIVLFLMTAIQGIILSVVLWKHKSNRVQNRILGWLLFVYAFIFVYFIITNFPAYYYHPMYPGVTASWILGTITINLLLMYLRACFGLRPSPPHAAWYWLPTAFFVVLTIARYAIGPQVVAHFLILGWVGLGYIAAITALCHYKFRQYASRSDSTATSSSTKRYLKLMLFFFAFYSVSQIIGFILYPIIPERASLYISIFVKLFTAVGVYAIAYLNVQNAHQVAPVMMAYPEPVEKYKFSSLDDDTANYILHRLQKLLETDKVYLQRDLRLKDVADKLGASVHHVSQVLNERLQLSFNDFINKRRIEEARQMLSTGDDSKIESIALDTGFNNKVSFNKAFKKFTGTTPSQYKAGQEGGVTG